MEFESYQFGNLGISIGRCNLNVSWDSVEMYRAELLSL